MQIWLVACTEFTILANTSHPVTLLLIFTLLVGNPLILLNVLTVHGLEQSLYEPVDFAIINFDIKLRQQIWLHVIYFTINMECLGIAAVLPHQVKTQYLAYKTTFFYLGRYLKKLADNQSDQCSSLTKRSIYYIKRIHIYNLLPHTVVDWPEIWCLMKVSTMFYICRYCVFTWDGSIAALNVVTQNALLLG